jgi:hypothetical protein
MQNPYAVDGATELRARWEAQGAGLTSDEKEEGVMGQVKG